MKKNKKNVRKRTSVRRVRRQRNSVAFANSLNSAPGGNIPFAATTPAPTSYGAVAGTRKYFPMTNGMGRSLVVANFEQAGVTFTGTGGFTNGGSVCNPGITTNYPWLSSIAANYQKFRWKFLRYIFVPQCASTTPGSVYLEMHYDYLDNASTSLAQVTATESSIVGNCWYGGALSPELAFGSEVGARDAICLTIDVSRFTEPWYYVRTTNGATLNTVTLTGTATGGNGTLAIASGGTFDPASRPGTIYYGTNGITNTTVAGNLYVAYVCEFSDPILAAENV